jgi:Lar family restriction alleviation protein
VSERDAIEACPFCGGEARCEIGKSAFEDAEIVCQSCAVTGPNYDDGFGHDDNRRLAISAWNTRTLPPAEATTLAEKPGQP